MSSCINTLSWNSNKTVRIITYSEQFYQSMKSSDELAVRAIIDLHIRWLNRNAPLTATQHYAICTTQQDELNQLGTIQFAQLPRLNHQAYQAVQWMIEGIDKGSTPDFKQDLDTLNTVIKNLRSII